MIPLFHDLEDERVVIFGGGRVAARKTALFGREATVIVASETFHDRFDDLPCRPVQTDITSAIIETLVDGAFLAIPATDDESLNRRIGEIARDAGCLVNPVDRAGSTITPSTIDGSNLTVAISTGGRSPAVSKYLRKRLEPEIERADPMVAVQSTIRTALSDRSASDRRERLWEVLEDERVWAALEDGDRERAMALAREHV